MLRLMGVSKRYGRGSWVLRDVDLDIPDGEVLAITGANGSGKSTLLRILVGVARPTHGTVSGRPEVIGYVPDRFSPHERLSAMAYLTHVGRIRGLSTGTAATRADELVDRLDLVGGRTAPLRTLSKGNAQKVALAQVLLVAPRLLVLDEPWSGLDTSAHGVLCEIIRDVAGAGGAVVSTEHRESIIAAQASRAYAVDGGAEAASPDRSDQPARRRQAATVVLTEPVAGNRPQHSDWSALEGVDEVVEHDSAVTIRVAPGSCDALLRTALRRGWSVDSVTRAGEPSEVR